MAGQTMEAGTVDLVATEVSDGVEVCATLYLDGGWELQTGDESIKVQFPPSTRIQPWKIQHQAREPGLRQRPGDL